MQFEQLIGAAAVVTLVLYRVFVRQSKLAGMALKGRGGLVQAWGNTLVSVIRV